MNKYKTDIKKLLTSTGNVNTFIITPYFKDTELGVDIMKETEWVDKLQPELSIVQRIILIRDNMVQFKKCHSCGKEFKFKDVIKKTSNYCSKSCSTKDSSHKRVESQNLNKSKKCINYRLLKYPLEGYDYNKINNKAYNKRQYSKLLANYLWFKYKNLDLVTKSLLKHSKQKVFNIIKADLSFLIPEYEKQYNLDFSSGETFRILIFQKEPKLCKQCHSIMQLNNDFCSVKCANTHKGLDTEFRKTLSKAITKSHINSTEEQKKNRYKNVSDSIHETNNKLTQDEKSLKYSNKTIRFTSFDNYKDKLYDIEFLFNSEYFYSNRYLPVKCKKCSNTWEMTKSTTMSCTKCLKCNPSKKAQTQTEIFEYISEFCNVKNNDKTFLDNRKELDILCNEYKFAVEFDGLLYHSKGLSKYPLFDNPSIGKYYHLDKTIKVQEKGYSLYHIFENEWLDLTKREIWKSIIKEKICLNEKIDDCIIKNIDKEKVKEFMLNNSLDKYVESDINLGLYSNSELYSVVSFNKIKDKEYRIVNLSTKKNYSVDYSILISRFEEEYKPSVIEYYSNRRYLTEINGFNFVENTEPRCFKFFVNKNILEECVFSDKLFEQGYRVIYDCGYSIFRKVY